MGLRGELYTTEVTLDNRTYFFNVKENRTGDVFLQVVESKSTEGTGFDRHAIVVFEDDMQKFLKGLESTLMFIEKNRKARLKETAERGPGAKRKFVRKAADGTPPARERADKAEGKPAKAAPKRVKVIAKKDLKKG
jgi:hypothetical protein